MYSSVQLKYKWFNELFRSSDSLNEGQNNYVTPNVTKNTQTKTLGIEQSRYIFTKILWSIYPLQVYLLIFHCYVSTPNRNVYYATWKYPSKTPTTATEKMYIERATDPVKHIWCTPQAVAVLHENCTTYIGLYSQRSEAIWQSSIHPIQGAR